MRRVLEPEHLCASLLNCLRPNSLLCISPHLPVVLLEACVVLFAFHAPSLGAQDIKQESKRPDAASAAAPTLPPALRIVKLLWNAQPQAASSALEKAMDQSLSRRQLDELRPHLAVLAPMFAEAVKLGPQDIRWVSAVAALTLTGDQDSARLLAQATAGGPAGKSEVSAGRAAMPLAKRELLLRVWLQVAPEEAMTYVRQALAVDQEVANASIEWLETVALRGMQADRQATSRLLIERWQELPKAIQIAFVEPLTEQAASMKLLVAAIETGTISKDLLNTNQLLKWSGDSDGALVSAIERVWGKLRVADDADRKAVVTHMLTLLASGKSGNPVAGEQTFKRICAQCHRLHGEGIEVGPDITGNGRGSFEQLVSNVMDPSLVIGKAFLAKTVLTSDGRVLSGLVAAEDDQRLTIKIQGGKLVELAREDEIEQIKDSVKSLMPDGLEQQMSEQELIDLFAYLSLAKPLGAPENDTIPGTPDKLIAQ